MHRVSVLVALLGLVSHPGLAQDFTARQQEILRTAIATDGRLTEQMHKEFWSAVPTAVRSDPKAVAAVSHVDRTSALALRFQKATWSSIKLSLAEKRIVKSGDYEGAKAEVLNRSTNPLEHAYSL